MLSNKFVAFGTGLMLLMGLGACGGTGQPAAYSDASGKAQLNVWAWDPTLKPVVAAFKKANPDIDVKMTNAGTSTDEYTALSNAITAGSGAPDVAQFEYTAIPQYTLNGALIDLSSKGAKDFKSFYTNGTWTSVNYNGGIYALPLDSGPMAYFYNKAIFDKAGISRPPETWDEYYEDAKKIHALGDQYYITGDSGDVGMFNSMIWQSGGEPYKSSGNKVTINLTGDAGAKRYYAFEQKLIQEGLINTSVKAWSDDWYRGLNDGTVASLTIGAWMPTELIHGAPTSSGNWRVALTPQWNKGDSVNSENGGSALGIIKGTKNEDAAYKFVEFASHSSQGVRLRVDDGAFPSDKATLANPDFLNKTDKYFGGQKYNVVLAQSAKNVNGEFQFLPYHVYAISIFPDTAGQAWTQKTGMLQAVTEWQNKLVSYGNQQGFTMNK